ncbi:copper resistance CopC/CopD family protein [Bacillus sp. CGMCC 1.16607]|uniref:copper resistance CopC/CopD family protein n=1 Tax=Bacillus sp. CGMCC 1.16607 TaxID=3351842 RepID=UPI0036383A73
MLTYVRQPFIKKQSISLMLLFFILIIPQSVNAHALLEKATPTPNNQILSSPKEIVLLFNERLEDELYSIKVFNNRGESISKSKTELSVDQKQLSQNLPSLANGTYTVSYSVLSADGHPVKGSYMISIGEVSDKINTPQQDVSKAEGSILNFIVRIIYFIALLLVTGWIMWGTVSKVILLQSQKVRRTNRKWVICLLSFFFLANIGFGYVQFSGLLDSWNLGELISLLFGTTIGITWLASMLLSFVGFFILLRHTWVDRAWAFILLAAKSINGHSMAYDPRLITVSLDLIHLLAAAIWAGGLLYILIYWKKHDEHSGQFLRIFSKAALFSIVILIVTGSILSFIFLPKLPYVLYTQWGKYLLAKVGLVFLIILLGSILRHYLTKKNEYMIGKLMKVDFALMILILCIVGIFTYLSPLPENKPFAWHEQDGNIGFTANISPKIPGTNTFMVEASSDKAEIKMKRIELILKNKDNPEVAPIQIPFPDYEQAPSVHYMIDGPYLPFAGNWTVEIRILDSDDNEMVYRKDFVVY